MKKKVHRAYTGRKKQRKVDEITAGQPKKFEEKPTQIRVVLPPIWKDEDIEESLRLGIVSESSGTPKIAELYRRMRTLWYQTPKKVRDKIDSI